MTDDEAWLDRLTWATADAFTLARRFHEAYERLAPEFAYETRKDSAVLWHAVPLRNKALMIAVATELLAAGMVSAPPVGYLIAGAKPDPGTRLPMPGRIDADWDGEIHPDRMSADAAYADLCERLPGTAESGDPREYRLYEVRPAAKVYAETADDYAIPGPYYSADEMFDALGAASDLDKPRPDAALTVEEAGEKLDAEFGEALASPAMDDDPVRAAGLLVICPRCSTPASTRTRTTATCDSLTGCGWSSEDGVPPTVVRPVTS